MGSDGHGEPGGKAVGTLGPGTRLGPYEIQELIGTGGMGQVYRALDTRLDRVVAIKTLSDRFVGDEHLRQRFEREARAISRLNHPHICTLYDVGRQDDIDFLVMEYIEGETLAKALEQGPLPLGAALTCARQVAEGLERAHDAGIVHRDLKPANVILSASGAKLLDFGVAKGSNASVIPGPLRDGRGTNVDPGPEGPGLTMLTKHGTILGTAPYMAPEQVEGRPVDALTDQFSFGATLYEMLTGQYAFGGRATEIVARNVLRAEPPPLKKMRPDVPADVEEIVMRCVARDPQRRFASTAELTESLREAEARHTGISGLLLDTRTVAVASLSIVTLLLAAGTWWLYDDVVRWLERETLTRVDALTDSGDLAGAFASLYPVVQRLPRDPVVGERLDRISLPVAINTEPAGATLSLRPYGTDEPWIEIGETPLVGQRVPYAMMDWRLELEDYATFEGAPFGVASFTIFANGYGLVPEADLPAGMVKIPGGDYQRQRFPPVTLDDYWLDRYEVSNGEFAEFVADRGYERREFWQNAFIDGTRTLEFAEAMSRFVDRAGQPGPAVWIDGAYPADGRDMPVRGLSWFEASAYCAYRGKALPTLFHWSAATRQEQLSDIVSVSNFGEGPAPVGSHRGLSDFGAVDLAGNVREWVHNDSGTGRYILGGAWSDQTYAFHFDADSADPWSRAETNGFRCAQYSETPAATLTGPLVLEEGRRELQFVSDEVYDAYRRIFAYDPAPLDARVEESREDASWRYELVSFTAAYGGERVLAHLFLPHGVPPPFQAVVWFPGNDAFFFGADGPLASTYLFDFLPRQGRALVYPVYQGTYQRALPSGIPAGPNAMRDSLAVWSKDLARTIDYLTEREDIDDARLAYYGFSSGAVYGPILTAVEQRFAASVLLGGGMADFLPPDTSLAAFGPRSTVPTLMINGVDDFIMPFSLAQQPMFDLLGAPQEHKRHARLAGGHIPSDRQAMIDEINTWLDRYLGPVDDSLE